MPITRDTTRLSPESRKFLKTWAYEHALEIGLDPVHEDDRAKDRHPRRIMIHRFNTSLRRSDERNIQPEFIIQFTQRRADLKTGRYAVLPTVEPRNLKWPNITKKLTLLAGTTVIADIDGRIRHIVAKPLPLSRVAADQNLFSDGDEMTVNYHRAGLDRLEEMLAWAVEVEDGDPLAVWEPEQPAVHRQDFASLHLDLQEAGYEAARKRRAKDGDEDERDRQ